MREARASLCTANVQNSTLRASQKLSEDFRASIEAARTIRSALQSWYSALPETLQLKSRLDGGQPQAHQLGVATLHISYLTLELFLYRAILRCLAKSPPPPPILPETSNVVDFWTGTALDLRPSISDWLLDDLAMIDFGSEKTTANSFTDMGDAAEATLNAAEKCAGIFASFVSNLVARDFDIMWYPCEYLYRALDPGRSYSYNLTLTLPGMRVCFAAVSSFIVLLLVQAPTPRHASRSVELLQMWSSALQSQHKSNPRLLTLGLVRLHGLQASELGQAFMLSPAAAEVLGAYSHDHTETT